MKKVLFIAVMMLAALGATAGEDPDDYSGYIIVPDCTPGGTVVWSPTLDQSIMDVINQMVPPVIYKVAEYSPDDALDYFYLDPNTHEVKVKEDVKLDYDKLYPDNKFILSLSIHGFFSDSTPTTLTDIVIRFAIGKVSMAEGTEDANSWELGANESVVPPGIKATYSGKRKVKSVTAKRKEN